MNEDFAASGSNVFVARQPIFHTNMKIYGYELLFRSGVQNFFDLTTDGDKATSIVITNSFLLIGIKNITYGKKAFINFTGEMILNGFPALLPKDSVVVEILENVIATRETVEACQGLAKAGYALAMDDFHYTPDKNPFVKLAQIIKLDISNIPHKELSYEVKRISSASKKPIKFLAERVETLEDFEACKKIGFDFYQGYFFSKPNIVAGKDIPGTKITYLRILRELQDENYNYSEISKLISTDPSLSYKLIKYVNSAFFGISHQVDSLQSAIAMVGEISLRKWMSLMILSYLAADKPSELLSMALLRALFCEQLGKDLSHNNAEIHKYHTVGLFSMLDVMLDQPMEVVLGELGLSLDIEEALLAQNNNDFSYVLGLVKAYEAGDWEQAEELADMLRISSRNLPQYYANAVCKVNEFFCFA